VGVSSENGKREAIIKASSRVFPGLGYHNASVEDIIKKAGVARSTFYSYFSSKRELFVEVMTGIMNDILGRVEAGVDDVIEGLKRGAPSEEKMVGDITAMMSEVFHYIEQNKGMTKTFLHELVGIDSDMTALFHNFEERVTDQFERLIVFGERTGVIRKVNERRSAEFVVGGLVHLGRNISAGVGRYDIDEMSRDFVELHLMGLLERAA
jgi:AcrR family transcriptional regulator